MIVVFDPSRCKLLPRPYQAAGVKQLLARPRYGLFWEMRLGKSKVVIDAACALFDAGELDVVVVACPAQVKAVWLDFDLGEIAKHSWVKHAVADYKGGREKVASERSPGEPRLKWIVTSYEFLRQENANGNFAKVEGLLQVLKGLHWMLVCDESVAISNHKSLQHRAILRLSRG